jgi:lysozyme family protein
MDSVINSILKAEAGLWNDPIGGTTNFGIRQASLDEFVKVIPTLPKRVEDLTESHARVILLKFYLQPFRLERVPSPLALVLGHGVVMAWDDIVRDLQRELGFSEGAGVDGIIGSQTLARISKLSHWEMLRVTANITESFLASRDNQFKESYYKRFANLSYH